MSNHALNSPASPKGTEPAARARRSRFVACRAASHAALHAAPSLWATLGALAVAWVAVPAEAAPGTFASPMIRLAAGAVESQLNTAPLQLKVERGGRLPLPMANVTRVITDDVDVAKASFQGSQAFVEGVSSGSSMLEVQTADGRVQKVIVEVVAPGSLPILPTVPSGVPATAAPAQDVAPSGTSPAVALAAPAIVPAPPDLKTPSPHIVSVRVRPAEDNAGQAVVTITYQNKGAGAHNVTVHAPIDDVVSYVTNSATQGARYDSGGRELLWDLSNIESGGSRQVSFRVEPLDRGGNRKFVVYATISGDDGGYAPSQSVPYSFVTTPLLTVFALPDRIMAGRVGPVLVDVRGEEAQATIDRLQKMGVVNGRDSGMFYPAAATQRAEYVVMTLKGLNLRDLRDVTAIKFVLTRRSLVNLSIKNSAGQAVANIVRNQTLEAGEQTKLWDGRSGSGFVAPGRYLYECTARDSVKGETTTLSGVINVVPQTPLRPLSGPSPFRDVKESDWFSGLLSLAYKQNLAQGYPDKKFHPTQAISRLEATVLTMRALGLEDLAKSQMGVDSGFLDYQDIPRWGSGYVNVAVIGKAGGRIIKGFPSNFFRPLSPLRRADAALIMQRLIDRDANRRISVSGAMVPGAVVTINNRTVESADDGGFQFVIDQDSANPITVAVTQSN